jgi:hypothetical protein
MPSGGQLRVGFTRCRIDKNDAPGFKSSIVRSYGRGVTISLRSKPWMPISAAWKNKRILNARPSRTQDA